MGKTRDLLKKIRDTKGTFHAKRGTIKDRNGKGLPEAEEINKNWQEYTKELCKNTHKNCTIKFLMTRVTTVVWSLT